MTLVFLLYYFITFIFGLVAGSFLNCVVYRLALPNFSFWKNLGGQNRSYCPECKHVLSWRDLIPVFSFLFLKGKCRYCSKKISVQYPLVELITALSFVLIFNFSVYTRPVWGWQFLIDILFLLVVFSFLIIIFVYDLKYYIIPDKILFPAIAIVFLYQLIFSFRFLNFNSLWAGLGACAFFLFLFIISGGRWMGFGDVKLAFFMGLFLGYPNILVALFLAFFLGAIIGVGLIIFGNKNLKSEIPFGPFLITGTFLALLWGQEITNWYMNLFL